MGFEAHKTMWQGRGVGGHISTRRKTVIRRVKLHGLTLKDCSACRNSGIGLRAYTYSFHYYIRFVSMIKIEIQ